MTEDLWPTEIRLSADRRVLNVAFEDGARYALPAEYLRVSSPSAATASSGQSFTTRSPGNRAADPKVSRGSMTTGS